MLVLERHFSNQTLWYYPVPGRFGGNYKKPSWYISKTQFKNDYIQLDRYKKKVKGHYRLLFVTLILILLAYNFDVLSQESLQFSIIIFIAVAALVTLIVAIPTNNRKQNLSINLNYFSSIPISHIIKYDTLTTLLYNDDQSVKCKVTPNNTFSQETYYYPKLRVYIENADNSFYHIMFFHKSDFDTFMGFLPDGINAKKQDSKSVLQITASGDYDLNQFI